MCAKRYRHNISTAQAPVRVPGRSSGQSDPGAIPAVPVLYIHPAKHGVAYVPEESAGRPYGVIPVGITALVNVLRENGIRVRGINYALEKQLNPRFQLHTWLRSQPGARVVLLDMHWYEHVFGAIDTARACKAALPGVWTILGGLSASGFSHDILTTCPDVDFVIRGDAEIPLLELVQLLLNAPDASVVSAGLGAIPNLSYRLGGEVIENAQSYCADTAEMDRLNFTDLDFLEHYREYFVHEYIVTDLQAARAHLETSPFLGRWLCNARGCKFHCSYCGGSKASHKLLAGRNGLVVRSANRMVDDLEQLEKKGIIQASFTYDIAEMGQDYWEAIFTGIRDRGLKIGLYNEFFQMPSPEFVRGFAETANLEQSAVALSPLCGNERVRRLNGKHYSNAQLFEMLDLLGESKIFLFIYFSLNLPGVTEEVFEETLDLATDIYHFYPSSLLKILNTNHTVDPFSPMNISPEKYGIQVSMKSFADFYEYCRKTTYVGADARTELNRGFQLADENGRSLKRMADRWDAVRVGKEANWWPVPPGW